MSEQVKEETKSEVKSIPVDWNNPEFQQTFVMLFNRLEARVSALEALTAPLLKQARIEVLEKELAVLKGDNK